MTATLKTLKRYNIIFLFSGMLLLGCNHSRDVNAAKTKAATLFSEEMEKPGVHNAELAVYSPELKINWSFGEGKPFYTASIGKTFTATAIALLVEEGRLSFDDPICDYLPDSITTGLHVLEGKDFSCEITIAQLLQHTSGLPDYFEGETRDGSPSMLEMLFSDTSRYWDPVETIYFTREKMTPHFEPGTGYQYSDTEYVLLGLIVESLSEVPLHQFFREQIFAPLDMQNTYMFLRSEPIGITGKSSEFWAGELECSTYTSLSADWAGGGIISTCEDLIAFNHALMMGELISPGSLEKMQQWTSESMGTYYGFGLRKIEVGELNPSLPDIHIIGHSGTTASFMYYCPSLDVYMAGTLNQTTEARNTTSLMAKVLTLIEKMAH